MILPDRRYYTFSNPKTSIVVVVAEEVEVVEVD